MYVKGTYDRRKKYLRNYLVKKRLDNYKQNNYLKSLLKNKTLIQLSLPAGRPAATYLDTAELLGMLGTENKKL